MKSFLKKYAVGGPIVPDPKKKKQLPGVKEPVMTEQLAAALTKAAQQQPLTMEGRVNAALGDPKGRAARYSESLVGPDDEAPDNVRHSLAGAYTAQGVADRIKKSSPVQGPLTTIVANAAGVATANLLGAGHEIKHLPQLLSSSWNDSGLEGVYHAIRMTGEDAANNFIGSLVGTLRDLNGTDAAEVITFLSNNNLMPDGVSIPSTAIRAGSRPDQYAKKKEQGNKYEEGGKFQEQAKKAQEMRPFARKNPDGTHSTVLMASAAADGKFYAFPTIFPAEGNKGSSDPKDWIEPKDPFLEAKKRGELFVFDTEDEALNFAEGSWKGYTNVKPKNIWPVIRLSSK